ncbi:MAG: DUF1934 domain-containing protein [Clostridiales bacterium]|nr:DUF1934 domain-containing protein [Clostridiales bacterium]
MQAIPMLISIHSNAHRDEANEDETLTMLTSGVLELYENRAVIRYEETLEEGMPAQRVTVTIENDVATMSRNGDYATDMVFRMGCRYEGQYHTPYGDMELAVYCTRLRYDLAEDGGELLLSYQLDLNGRFAAVHDMELRLMRQGDD